MILPKACPRCIGGDIIVRSEDNYMVATCLQCGYSREFRPGYGLKPSAVFIRDALARERGAATRIRVNL
jgi:Zn ribbon nucleic-acid-binding protein